MSTRHIVQHAMRTRHIVQHAIRTRHIVIRFLPRSATIFSTLSHKQHDFRGEKNIR
jgi:hypothetical protein